MDREKPISLPRRRPSRAASVYRGDPQLKDDKVDRYWRLYASSIINELHRSVSEHDEIVAAIRKGDIQDVRRALDQNWAGGFERIRGLIEIFGERGSW